MSTDCQAWFDKKAWMTWTKKCAEFNMCVNLFLYPCCSFEKQLNLRTAGRSVLRFDVCGILPLKVRAFFFQKLSNSKRKSLSVWVFFIFTIFSDCRVICGGRKIQDGMVSVYLFVFWRSWSIFYWKPIGVIRVTRLQPCMELRRLNWRHWTNLIVL